MFEDAPFDEAVESDRFVRRQRRDALGRLRSAPPCSSHASPVPRPLPPSCRPSCSSRSSSLPNPQDLVIAQQREIREAADRQAERLDYLAEDLD